MDEPTSALDPVRTRKIAEAIKALTSIGLHIIVTTHDLSLIEMLPCTIHLMKAGTIVESISSSNWIKEHDTTSLIAQFAAGKSSLNLNQLSTEK
jgi:ABC-type multidrug transport system ATPase subunit